MAETIRDVTIRIALELKKADLKVPDLSTAGFEDVARDVSKVTDEIKTAADAVKEYDRIQKETNKQTAAGVEAVAAEWGKIDSELGNLIRSLGAVDQQNEKLDQAKEKFERLAKSEKEAAKAAKELAREGEKAAAALNAIPKQIQAELQNIGAGALKAARGFALLGASEESIEDLVKTLAKFQGVIDVFEGTTRAARAILKVTRLLQTASVAASNGNKALAASNVLVTITARGAAKSLVAMIIAAGPLIAIVVGLGLAIAIVVKWMEAYSTAAKNATLETEGMRRAAEAASRVNFSFSDSLKSAAGDFLPIQKQIELTKQSIADLEAQRTKPPLRTRTAGDQFEIREQELERQIALGEKISAQERQLGNLKLSANQAQRESFEISKRQLETAQQAADAEAKKEASMRAQIGSASALERIQLERIVAELEGGKKLSELRKSELNLLGRFGGGEKVSAEFGKRDEGLTDRLAAQGLGSGRTQRDQLASLEGAITSGKANITASEFLTNEFTKLNESDARAKKKTVEIITALAERNNELFEQLQQIVENAQSTANNLQGVN